MLDECDSVFSDMDSPTHRRWRRDHRTAMDVPPQHRLRGCLGLAAMLAEDAKPLPCAGRILVPNEPVTWMAMRDLPPGCFPASRSLDDRTMRYVSHAVASLRFGVPTIGLDTSEREAFDFSVQPADMVCLDGDGEWVLAQGDVLNSTQLPREFAVATAISNWMTRAACFGLERDGGPVNPAWHEHRPDDGRCFQLPSPAAWMFQPYISFPLAMRRHLFHLATESPPVAWMRWCAGCRRWIAAEDLPARSKTSGRMDADNAVGTCPRCRRRQRWNPDEAVPGTCHRFFAPAFHSGFCRDLAEGLPLVAIEDCIYVGANRDDADGSGLIAHHFRSRLDGRQWGVALPVDARILASRNAVLNAGAVWCRVLGQRAAEQWSRQDPKSRWARLADLCDGAAMLCQLQKLWFDHKMLRLPEHPDQIVVAAELAGPVCRHVESVGLWWDIGRCQRHWNETCRSFVFPPIPLKHWQQLRMMLQGEVQLCAGIGDPRFAPPDAQAEPTSPDDEGDADPDLPSTWTVPAASRAA